MRESDGCMRSWFSALRKPVGLSEQMLVGYERIQMEEGRKLTGRPILRF